ncbi:GGDEF domain-containing protein [Deinococcus maricopensis]|uniref:Diguanylate cyclase n=1 Tax=Deinococcus maricopensis (strain DSM 21211 / LMG 22137 / NRRL B-23946 / LB-34) TaxID=709986 RepID=E8UA97_DEIML|nr:diguanylate cyclase [Deinococcus maricopensis]ADV67986.1 diguanylate cyclase [Deinococcus maricopensis DSM 21211]
MTSSFSSDYLRALERVFRRIMPLIGLTELARAYLAWPTNAIDGALNLGIAVISLGLTGAMLRWPQHALRWIHALIYANAVVFLLFNLFGYALMPAELNVRDTSYVLTGKYIYLPFILMVSSWLVFPSAQARRVVTALYVAHVLTSVVSAGGALLTGRSDVAGALNLLLHHSLVGGAFVMLLNIFTDIYSRQSSLERERDVLEQYAFVDALTGLHNRRAFEQSLAQEAERAQHNGQPLSIIALDIDHFKRVNDTFGHDAGDHVLKDLARIVRREVRATDVVARWGGEEFILLLPTMDLPVAQACAERIRRAVDAHEFSTGPLSVSLGVATLLRGEDTGALFGRADAALYSAKRAGRNRVVTDDTPTLLH